MVIVLSELLQGEHAHTNPLLCIDVSAEVAGEKPFPLPHSVFELVWHMNYWMSHELSRINGQEIVYPEHAAGSWPIRSAPDPNTWSNVREKFNLLLKRLQKLAILEPKELARIVPTSSKLEGARDFTVEEIIWQTAVHNSYHIGQVVLVRQILGAWPPKEGSDTW